MDHLKTHSGEKSSKCNQCEFASSYVNSLRGHMKIHNREKIECEMCEFKTSKRVEFERHTKSCHNCGQCEFKTENQNDLIIHRKTEHKFKCTNCSFQTGSIS